MPVQVQDVERRKRNLPVKTVIRALIFCQKNPRIIGDALKKMRDTKFKGFPVHLDIGVLPDLVKYGSTFMRIAAIQKLLDADPEPIEDSLMSPQQPMEAATSAADEPQEETRIDDE